MEAKKEGFIIASEEPSAQVSEQVEAQQVYSSETTEEVTADSVADTQPDEAQVALEEEAPKPMPELNMEKEQEKIKKEVLTFAIFGQMGAGKSSFLNTIAREKLLNVSEQRTTSTISIIRHIENFDGYKNGDIEVTYKSKNRILEEIKTSINKFNEYSDRNIVSPDTIEIFLENKDKTLEIITKGDIYTEIDRKYIPKLHHPLHDKEGVPNNE